MKGTGILTAAAIVALSTTAIAADQTLVSTKAGSAIILDGQMDKAWEAAKEITVKVDELPYEPSNGFEGMQETDVKIKSLYDDTHVYFLFTYKDPTKSLERFPWVKQDDGSWKKLSNKDDTEIARSLRNSFRASLEPLRTGGRDTESVWGPSRGTLLNQTPNTGAII